MSDTTQRESNSSDLIEKESECIRSNPAIPNRVVRPAASQIEDIRLAASKMREADRRSFQAEIALKYCGGSARMAEAIFGWGRESVEAGLGEKRTGIICLGARATKSGNKCWEASVGWARFLVPTAFEKSVFALGTVGTMNPVPTLR